MFNICELNGTFVIQYIIYKASYRDSQYFKASCGQILNAIAICMGNSNVKLYKLLYKRI